MKKISGVLKAASIACVMSVAFCASGATRTWTGLGVDNGWGTGANWSDDTVPIAGDVADFRSSSPVTVTVTDMRTVQQIQVNGSGDVVINIADGMRLSVANGGSTGIVAVNANITVNGPGKVGFSTAGGGNHLDNGAASGRAITVNAEIVNTDGGDATGFEAYRSGSVNGTFIVTCLTNAFTMDCLISSGHTVSVPMLADIGQPSPLGTGSTFFFNNLSVLRYTGTGDSTDRILVMSGGTSPYLGGGIEHAGTGPLTLTGPVYNNNNSAQTFSLLGNSASEARVTGDIYDNQNTLAIRKDGSGTWVLTGSNSFTGGLTINAGTLGLDSTNAFGKVAQITMASGAVLSVNPSATAGFTAALPLITASGSVALSVTGASAGNSAVSISGLSAPAGLVALSVTPAAAGDSTLTIGTLDAKILSITAQGIGTGANRIFINSLPDGDVGTWLKLNGGPATYDSVNGLAPMTPTTQGLATKGSTLPNDAALMAVIDTDGRPAVADIQLPDNPTLLYGLTMDVAGDSATVDTVGKVLLANEIAITAGSDALTIGAARQDGALLPHIKPLENAVLTLRNDSTTVPLTINAVIDAPQSGGIPPTPVIIDNLQAVFTGSWPTSTSNAGYHGTDYQHDDNSGKGTKSALFSTLLPRAGKWAVAGWWPNDNSRATAVPMDVTHASGTTTVNMNQRSTGGVWRDLGTFTFSASTPASVLIRTTGATDGNVIADAFRFTFVCDDSFVLFKDGPGDVVLAGGVMLFDHLLINDGNLTLDTPAGQTNFLSSSTSGDGKLTKAGPGTLLLPSTAASFYAGGTDILGGLVQAGNSRSLGTGPVVISGGGTLDIGGSTTADSITINNRITVSGAGVGGLGAIVNNGTVQQRNAFQNALITLAGPTTFGGSCSQRWDIAGMGTTLDLNNFTFAKAGVTDFRISPANVINAPAGVAFDIREGTLGLESQSIFAPNDAQREINIAGGGARLGLYNTSIPLNWKINPADGATIWAYGGNEGTNLNILTSAMTLPGTLNLTVTSGNNYWNKNLTGKLSGPGGLSVRDGTQRTMNLLSHPANDFTGPVTVNNSILGLRYPGSLLSLAQLTLQGNGCVGVFMGGPGEWTSADVMNLTTSGKFLNNGNRLHIRVEQGNTATLTHDIGSSATPFIAALDKNGMGTLVVDANVTLASSTSARMNNGAIVLTNNAIWTAGVDHLYLQDYTLSDGSPWHLSTFTLRDNAQYLSTDRGYNINGGPTIRIPQNAGRAVLELKDDAFIRANMYVGGADGQTGAHGAVYQSGNSTWLCTGGANNDAAIGRAGLGYYQLDSGTLTLKGYTTLGWTENSACVGILRQTGGTLAFNGQRDTPPTVNGTLADSYNGEIDLSRGGTGVLHLEGGIFEHYGNLKILSEHNGNNSNGNSGTGIMTVAGTADAMVDRPIEMGNRNSGTAILNLCGGKLTTTGIRRMDRPSSTATLNFNGGTLRVTNDTASASLFVEDNPAAPLAVNVYGNGGTIDLADGVTRTVDVPIRMVDGAGIESIALTAGGSGYIAPPHVSITGGNGSGATAIAHIDRASGSVTRIEITCPGHGYTANPTVTLTGGGGSGITVGTITRAFNGWGGITKTGPGTLVLNAPCTYIGPTRVDGGTLLLANPKAIHEHSEIIIGDGTLDLGGLTITNYTVTLVGSGTIINGKVFAAAATKVGSTPTTWGAEVGFLPAPGIPGLWEGYIASKPALADNLDTAYPNPCTAIELTTTAANGYQGSSSAINGKLWANNSTWVYTGYIWNHAATNEVWTFAEHFDDDVWLKIDGIVVLSNTSSSTYSSSNYMLTPGPHRFEIRFAQGSGGVGRSNTGLWFNNNNADPERGWGIDFLGRNSTIYENFVLPKDPGDGSLFTVTPGTAVPDAAIRVLPGGILTLPPASGLLDGVAILLDEGGTLDLNGQSCDRVIITGNGTVINPAPGSGITLSPAGDDRTGTMALEGLGNGTLNGATYRLTVHDLPPGYYDDIPGLYEGRVSQGTGNISTTLRNPGIGDPGAIEPTVTAANGSGTGNNFVINGKVWPFNCTWVYTGYIWNRADTNETWTFAKSFDDTVWMKIDDTVPINHGTWNAIYKVNVTLTPGPHEFEIRFGQGDGGIGAQRQGWWTNAPTAVLTMPVGIDFLGRNEENCENYSPFHVSSGGIHAPLFTVTVNSDPDNGVINDVLTSTGQVDLTGLTIVPSDQMSIDLPGAEYLIALADGGFIGAAKVTGFNGKWFAVRKGNGLWLTTKGGTMLIIR